MMDRPKRMPVSGNGLSRRLESFKPKDESGIVQSAVPHPDILSTQIMMRAYGKIRVGVPVFFEHLFIQRFLHGFMMKFKDVAVEIVPMEGHLDDLPDGIDICVRLEEDLGASTACTKIGSLKQAVYAHKNFILDHGVPQKPHQLPLNESISMHIKEHDVWTFNDLNGQHIIVKPKSRLVINNYDTIVTCVNKGLGIALLPKMLCEYNDHENLIELLRDYPADPIEVFAVSRQVDTLPLQVRTFIDHMKKMELQKTATEL